MQVSENKKFLSEWPNAIDKMVVEKLCTTPLLALPVDEFANLLCENEEVAGEQHILKLRYVLLRIYIDAAQGRLTAKASSQQISSTKKAVALLIKAIEHLDKVAPPSQRGLRGAFGPPADDVKGSEESNELRLLCWQIKLDIVDKIMGLQGAVERENQKPARVGERKKRLRMLVEGLADWWESKGNSLAPYVVAKRRDGDCALVIGRQGKFVSLAHAVLCHLDQFKASEVTDAITNVHEKRLAKKNSTGSAQ
jgi:hypothetical protein